MLIKHKAIISKKNLDPKILFQPLGIKLGFLLQGVQRVMEIIGIMVNGKNGLEKSWEIFLP